MPGNGFRQTLELGEGGTVVEQTKEGSGGAVIA